MINVVSNTVRTARRRLGYSMRELAARIPCDHAHLGRIERGELVPSPRVAKALERELGNDIVWLSNVARPVLDLRKLDDETRRRVLAVVYPP